MYFIVTLRNDLALVVPVYLYGEAATEEHRKTVPQIRLGEYEGLIEKVRSVSGEYEGLPEKVSSD